MSIDLRNRLFSYGALNTVSLFAYTCYLLDRMAQMKNIVDVNEFIFLSPILLAAIFYNMQEAVWDKKSLKIASYSALLIIAWIIMLKGLERIYNNNVMLIWNLFEPVSDIVYLFSFLAVLLVFISGAKKSLNPIINILLCYLIYGFLFLKTINSIKGSNGIETYYFVDPYIELMIVTIFIWIVVWVFEEYLKTIKQTESFRTN